MSTGTCGGGQIGDAVCANPGECCSAHGYCGTTPEHCAANGAAVDGMMVGEDKVFHLLGIAAMTCSVFALLFVAMERCYHRRKRAWGDDCVANARAEDDDVEAASSLPSRTNDGLGENNCLRFPARPRGYYLGLALIAGALAVAAGIMKEIFDRYEILWAGGDPSWGDVVADVIGAVVGELMIFVALHLRGWLIWLRFHVNSVRATASDEPGPEMRGIAHPN